MTSLAFVAVLSYLVGGIPTALLVAHWRGGVDLRRHGSGNVGATNALRLLGWPAGLTVLIVDVAKGFAAVWLLARIPAGPEPSEAARLMAASAVVIGHVWPVFAGFRGGRGVAPAGGVALALHPLGALGALALFAVVLTVFRVVSLASISAVAAWPVLLSVSRHVAGPPASNGLLVFAVGLLLLVLFTHRSNLRRLLAGEEPRVGESGRPAPRD